MTRRISADVGGGALEPAGELSLTPWHAGTNASLTVRCHKWVVDNLGVYLIKGRFLADVDK